MKRINYILIILAASALSFFWLMWIVVNGYRM